MKLGIRVSNFYSAKCCIRILNVGSADPTYKTRKLRHTFASLLISKNIPIKYIQRQMGHSSIKMTMDTYGHLMPDVHDHAINVLEEIANNADNIKPKKLALVN